MILCMKSFTAALNWMPHGYGSHEMTKVVSCSGSWEIFEPVIHKEVDKVVCRLTTAIFGLDL